MENSNQKLITCLNCEKVIALFLEDEDQMQPSVDECYAAGNIPVPNCGWFCSQNCASEFEVSHGVKFGRTMDGMIDYYRKDNPSR